MIVQDFDEALLPGAESCGGNSANELSDPRCFLWFDPAALRQSAIVFRSINTSLSIK